MKTNLKKLVTIIIFTVGVCTNTFAQTFQWAKSFGGATNEAGNALAMDQSGNILIAGNFTSTVDFDPGAGIYNMIAPFGLSDLFVTKLDPLGNFIWAKKIEGTGIVGIRAFILDTAGNLLISGFLREQLILIGYK
ncbi:MAG: hypothetical protein IPP32_12775 [Bacteroidetes bacterium]|nr:hypothetical protein [Bacteroidota bacterium]